MSNPQSPALNRVRALMDAPQDVGLPEELVANEAGFAPDQAGDDRPPPESYGDFDLDHGPDFGGGQEPPGGDPAPPEELCARLPLNDYGNGQRYVIHFGRDVMWVPRVGWFTWEERVWVQDHDGIAARRKAQSIGALIARETRYLFRSPADAAALAEADQAREVLAELEGVPVKDRTDEQRAALVAARAAVAEGNAIVERTRTTIGQRLTHAKNAGNSGPMTNMIAEAGIALARTLDQLDVDPLMVNTESGVLRFGSVLDEFEMSFRPKDSPAVKRATVDLVGHDRAQLLTKIMPVVYDPAARAPQFEAFLERVQPNPNMRAFLQRWFGLSLTGLTGEQKMVFLHGIGANGKSVLVDLLARMMGSYAASAKIESLTGESKKSGSEATPDLIPLVGARFVRASEPEEGRKLQEGMIKALTGGEEFLVRALHADFFAFMPRFKLTISGNHKPEIRGTDDGIWRRVLLVPFDVQIPKEERDPHMGEKLWAERSGILNWLVAGLRAYIEGGLQEPAQVLEATREFREESDPVGAFLEACCVVSGEAGESISSKELGEAFNIWLSERGEGTWQPATVARRLKEKAGRWRSPTTGCSFTARKSSTMKYDGLRFNDVFGPRYRDMPRDQQGRPIYGRNASTPEGFDL